MIAVSKVRLEVRLSAAKVGSAMADMRGRGVTSRADHVRDCLLVGRTGRADCLPDQPRLLRMALNEIAASWIRSDGEM